VDEKGLEKLAALTNGAYVRSVAGDMDLDLIYKDKIRGQMEGKTLTSGKQKVWENRFQWFLFPGLVLLLLESMLLPGKRSLSAILLIPVLSFALWGLPLETAQAGIFSSPVGKGIRAYEAKDYTEAQKQFIEAQIENPEDKRLYYNIGTAAYMNKEYEEAINHFSKALDAKDAGLRHNARFNLGNTHYQMGHMDEAIKEYEAVLKEFPDDREAKDNLDLALQKKQEDQKKQDGKEKQKEQKKQESRENKDKEKQDQDKGSQKDQENKNSRDQEKKDPQGLENKARQDQKQEDKDQKKDSGDTQGSPPDEKQDPQAGGTLDNMLNRLEDKPGGAMIPILQEHRIEKDW
jgi:Ca-activated chloride channel family protein